MSAVGDQRSPALRQPATPQASPVRSLPVRSLPSSTYRLQMRAEFTFDDARAVLDHLDSLGVSHVYLSPVLQATPGSAHGYDVVDHSQVNEELGGRDGLLALAAAARERGMGIVCDVVPNHMAVPTPLWHNRAMWSVLRDGPGSPFARWLDVDWTVESRAVLMPVLGERIGDVLEAGELSLDTVEVPTGPGGTTVTEQVLRYYDHVLPLRVGTEDLPLPELVDRQWYRLAHWRVADEELNYRRFFDVDTLAAVRVEDPEVFRATHEVLVELYRDGSVDGFRIDHPDGLADPAGYLERLAATGGGDERPWVVVEKILEGQESLVADWACDGTTGYETLARISGLLVNSFAAGPAHALYAELAGPEEARELVDIVDEAKREVVAGGQYAEVHRLVDLLVEICSDDVHLRDHTRRALHDCVEELLVAMDRYRAYIVPGQTVPAESLAVVEEAAHRARGRLAPERHATLATVVDLVLGRDLEGLDLSSDERDRGPADAARRRELVIRFQQTTGPVMAKGLEDTAFYRWQRFVALNEVGGDPATFGITNEEMHAFAEQQARTWPSTMTTLSTHDTKRSEDSRARLLAAVEEPERWVEAVRSWHEAAAVHRTGDGLPDGGTEYLLWQTLVATWPITPERLLTYLQKATREAKRHTTWTSPDEHYEQALADFAVAVLQDEELSAAVQSFVDGIQPWTRTLTLGQKLLQLCLPGVPDVYQGTELVDRSLVDPDNRRPVDYEDRRTRLARLDEGEAPVDVDDEKLLITARALRLRRERPDDFRGPAAAYHPLATSSGNAFAFGRGAAGEPSVAVVITRRPAELERLGGWGQHSVYLPEGGWTDVLSGAGTDGGQVALADLLTDLPVALLVRA